MVIIPILTKKYTVEIMQYNHVFKDTRNFNSILEKQSNYTKQSVECRHKLVVL